MAARDEELTRLRADAGLWHRRANRARIAREQLRVDLTQRAEKAEAERDELKEQVRLANAASAELERLRGLEMFGNAAHARSLSEIENLRDQLEAESDIQYMLRNERDTLKSTIAAVISLRDDWAGGRAPGFARELTETLEQGPATPSGTEEKETP